MLREILLLSPPPSSYVVTGLAQSNHRRGDVGEKQAWAAGASRLHRSSSILHYFFNPVILAGRWGGSCRSTGASTPWVTARPRKRGSSPLGATFAALWPAARYDPSACHSSIGAGSSGSFCWTKGQRLPVRRSRRLRATWCGCSGKEEGATRHLTSGTASWCSLLWFLSMRERGEKNIAFPTVVDLFSFQLIENEFTQKQQQQRTPCIFVWNWCRIIATNTNYVPVLPSLAAPARFTVVAPYVVNIKKRLLAPRT